MNGAGITFPDLIEMTFQKINPRVIVQSKIMLVQTGLGDETGITCKALGAYYLAGGDVPKVVQTIIAAAKSKIAGNKTQMRIENVPNQPGVALTIFLKVAEQSIAMNKMTTVDLGQGGLANILFVVSRENLPATLAIVEQAVEELGHGSVSYDDDVSSVE